MPLLVEPNFLPARSVLFEAVEKHVVRHTDNSLVAYLEIVGSDLYACGGESADFSAEMLKVDNHAVAHYGDNFRAEYSGGKQIKDKFAEVVYNRVSGVVAALITNDNVLIFGEKIDHSALTFIAPVYANNCR